MKLKIYTFLFILIGFCVKGYSQGNWELLIPSTTSNQMVSLYFIDEHTGLAVGEFGTITKTTDGGISWRIIELDLSTDLADVYFPSESVGYIVGTDGLILKSTTTGEDWFQQDNSFSNNLHRIRFRDEQTGWAIGEKGLILHTVNGGTTWQQQASNIPDDLYGLQIINTNHVCIAGDNGMILLTEDNGANWQIIPHDTSFCSYDVYFSNDSTGWLCGKNLLWEDMGIITRTVDGGKQWQTIDVKEVHKYLYGTHEYGGTNGFIDPLQQIYFKDDMTSGVALTFQDTKVLHPYGNFPLSTTDGGKNWHGCIEGRYEESNRNGRFQFLTETHLISTGYQGDYRFSDDSGRNWYYQNNEKRSWMGIVFGNAGIIHVRNSTEEGYKDYLTVDYGTSWEEITPVVYMLDGSQQELTTWNTLGHNTLNSDSRLWLCVRDYDAENRIYNVLYSDDLGRTYHQVRSGLEHEMFFLTPDTLIAYDLEYQEIAPDEYKTLLKIFYSFDGGIIINEKLFNDVWNDITPPEFFINPKFINDSYFFNGRVGFLVGSEGNIIKTEDTGQSWTNVYSGVVEDLWDIEFINRETGFVVGDFGRILKTDDGGATWRKTDSGTQEDIYTIAFLNETEGWVGTQQGLRYTNDGGETWTGVPLRYKHGTVHNIKIDNKGNYYAYTLSGSPSMWDPREYNRCGSYVFLLRRLNESTGVPINNINPVKSANIILYQNYPNPFNLSTQINFRITKPGIVKLIIYNLQGQLVRMLINQTKISGYHSITWDGLSDKGNIVSSGVYLYQLRCNNQIKTCKLLLLK